MSNHLPHNASLFIQGEEWRGGSLDPSLTTAAEPPPHLHLHPIPDLTFRWSLMEDSGVTHFLYYFLCSFMSPPAPYFLSLLLYCLLLSFISFPTSLFPALLSSCFIFSTFLFFQTSLFPSLPPSFLHFSLLSLTTVFRYYFPFSFTTTFLPLLPPSFP